MAHQTRLDRRALLTGLSLLTGGAALASPSRAAALVGRARAGGPAKNGRRLILVQLSGGNDGLSTVVPYADDAYYRARSSTQVEKKSVLRLDDYRGLHPALRGLRRLYDAGKLAVVEGAGYPQPVLSHFKSLEIWHTADRRGRNAGDGWAARLADQLWNDERSAELVVHVGRYAPYSIFSSQHAPIAFASPSSYQWFGAGAKARTWRESGTALSSEDDGASPILSDLRGVLDTARDSSLRVRRAVAEYEPQVAYPRDEFGAQLTNAAALIHAGLGTRVASVELRGFDTHAAQKQTHDRLMKTLDEGLTALAKDLASSPEGRDTLVVVFSEFGRRVEENDSKGHDHGKAGPMFVLGSRVKGGLYGEHPALSSLEEGNLAYTTDFRRVYASVIGPWFGGDAEALLGASYEPIDLV